MTLLQQDKLSHVHIAAAPARLLRVEKLAPERLLHPVRRCAPWESLTQAQHLDAREATYAPMPNLPAGLAIPASHLHALLLVIRPSWRCRAPVLLIERIGVQKSI